MCTFNRPWELRVGHSPHALPRNETFDIIFIDGDHSTKAVLDDYRATIHLLRPGGFMVFDDYLDSVHRPQVRVAVDDIARQTDLVPIGSPPNVHGIHPEVNTSFINEFIFQKKGKFHFAPRNDSKVKTISPLLCVTVATYRRGDGSTPKKLESIWRMLNRQSYDAWKLYLTGDFYDNATEWNSLSFYNDKRASLHNLPEPGERYKVSSTEELWNNAGATAMNKAIERVLLDGNEWAVHLDDDDFWDDDHLQNLVDGIRTGATFVMTQCQYHTKVLPTFHALSCDVICNEVLPKPCDVIHSSVAFNVAFLASRYKVFPGFPADAFLWSRIIFEEAFYPALVPVVLCHHIQEHGGHESDLIARKSTLTDRPIPPGWFGVAQHYRSLATETFPAKISPFCQFVIGPTKDPPVDYQFQFIKLEEEDIPHHVRVVESFAQLSVWKKTE